MPTMDVTVGAVYVIIASNQLPICPILAFHVALSLFLTVVFVIKNSQLISKIGGTRVKYYNSMAG